MNKKFIGKRLFSIMLALLMLLSVVPAIAADGEAIFYLADGFEDWATNQMPEGTTYTGFNAHVVELGNMNKGLYLEPQDNEIKVSVALPNVEEDFFFTMNFSVEGTISSGRVNLVSSSNATSNLINISNNALVTYDGKRGLPSLKKETSLTIGYKPSQKRLDVYNGNKLVLSNWFIKGGPSAVKTIDFAMETLNYADAKVTIDNVYVYSDPCGRKMGIPQKRYNEKVYSWEPDIYDEEPTVFVFKNFDSASGALRALALQTASGGAAIVEDGDESYYKIPATDEQYVSDIQFAGAKSSITYEMSVKQGNPGTDLNVMFANKENAWSTLVNVTATGSVTLGGTNIGGLVAGQWNHIAMAINYGSGTFDGYLNGKHVLKGARIGQSTAPVRIRFHRPPSSDKGSVMIDNLRVYSGAEVKELDDSPYTGISVLGGDGAAIKALAGKNAFHGYSDFIAVNGERKKSETPAYIEDGILYGAKDDFAEMLGAEVVASAGNTEVKVGEKSVTLDSAPVTKNDALYIPVKDLVTKLDKTIAEDERGIFIFADEMSKLSSSKLLSVNNYMQFTRLTPEQVLELLQKNATAHPYGSLSQDDVDRIRAAYKNDPVFKERVDYYVETQCMPERGVKADTYDWYAMNAFMIGYLATGQEYMFEKIKESVLESLEQKSWTSINDSQEPAHNYEYLAMSYDWLYDKWEPELRKRMEERLVEWGMKHWEKVLKGTDSNLTPSLSIGNNITGGCGGAVLMSTIACWDLDPERASYIIAECIRALEPVMNNYFPQGAWAEGLDYSSYMIAHVWHGVSAVINALGDDCGLLDAPGFKLYPAYYMSLHGPGGGSNFGDGGDWSNKSFYDGLVFPWAAHVYKDPEIYIMGREYMDFSGRPDYLEHVLFHNTEWEQMSADSLDLNLDNLYSGEGGKTEDIVIRSGYGKNDTFLATKFGQLQVGHGHWDGGSFIMDMAGTRWAIDLGKDDYLLPDYFTEYVGGTYYRKRAEGHNTMIINPDETPGQQTWVYAPVEKFENNKTDSFVIGDMSVYYPSSKSAKRGFMLTNNRKDVVIRDEVRMENSSEIYWFMHTGAEITIVDSDTAILTQDGKQVQLDFISNVPAELTVMDAVPLKSSPNPEGQNPNPGARKIAIRVPSATSLDLTVRIAEVGSSGASQPVPNVSLAQWSAK